MRERLAGIVASAMDAIITVDEREKIVLFNPAAEPMFGCSAEEALGASISRFIPKRYRDGHDEHIRRFNQTGATNRRMGALGAIWGFAIRARNSRSRPRFRKSWLAASGCRP